MTSCQHEKHYHLVEDFGDNFYKCPQCNALGIMYNEDEYDGIIRWENVNGKDYKRMLEWIERCIKFKGVV